MSDEQPRKHAPRGRIKADPMTASNPIRAPRCSARSKQTLNPCKQPAIAGGTVCRYHGGAAPQVMAKAEERLKSLIDPAITRLSQLIAQQEFPSVAIAAVKDVLDRNGALGKAREHFDVNVTTAEARVQRLVAARKRINAEHK